MKKNYFRSIIFSATAILILLGTLVTGMFVGLVTQKLKVFPYGYINKAYAYYIKWQNDDYGPGQSASIQVKHHLLYQTPKLLTILF